MRFTDRELGSVLDAWRASTDLRDRAKAHNIAFEERLDRQRLDAFEDFVQRPCPDHMVLRRQLTDFIKIYIEVATPHIPPTFQIQNSGASMGRISEEQTLVRMENITRHVSPGGFSLTSLSDALSSTDPAVLAKLEDFMDKWNLARDNRPTFAAFKRYLRPEFGDADWPHKLRDRLGLADYSASGGPLAVALMEYTVEDVLAEALRSPDIVNSFCFPTFLDSKPSSQFFPTPKELRAGAPMALFEIWSDDDLIAEVVHSRLTYRRQHIAKLGEITSDGPAVDFRALRNNHLAALRVAAVRDDFGEEL